MMARLLIAASSGLVLAMLALWTASASLPVTELRHGVGVGVAVVGGGLALRRLWRAFWLFGDIVFGQRASDGRVVTWLPGHGTHGGEGGHTPPYVPYEPDWDPKRRIR